MTAEAVFFRMVQPRSMRGARGVGSNDPSRSRRLRIVHRAEPRWHLRPLRPRVARGSTRGRTLLVHAKTRGSMGFASGPGGSSMAGDGAPGSSGSGGGSRVGGVAGAGSRPGGGRLVGLAPRRIDRIGRPPRILHAPVALVRCGRHGRRGHRRARSRASWARVRSCHVHRLTQHARRPVTQRRRPTPRVRI